MFHNLKPRLFNPSIQETATKVNNPDWVTVSIMYKLIQTRSFSRKHVTAVLCSILAPGYSPRQPPTNHPEQKAPPRTSKHVRETATRETRCTVCGPTMRYNIKSDESLSSDSETTPTRTVHRRFGPLPSLCAHGWPSNNQSMNEVAEEEFSVLKKYRQQYYELTSDKTFTKQVRKRSM